MGQSWSPPPLEEGADMQLAPPPAGVMVSRAGVRAAFGVAGAGGAGDAGKSQAPDARAAAADQFLSRAAETGWKWPAGRLEERETRACAVARLVATSARR
jgi:hypothetical protein